MRKTNQTNFEAASTNLTGHSQADNNFGITVFLKSSVVEQVCCWDHEWLVAFSKAILNNQLNSILARQSP